MGERALDIKRSATVVGGVAAAAALVLGVATSGAAAPTGKLPRFDDPVDLDPADFSADIDNRRWPMRVGSRWVYRVTDSSGEKRRDVITVTRRTKLIADGIEARVVKDVVTDHGKPVEVTEDWYAQDSRKNVWYFGEHTVEYKHGKAVDNGSWEAGVDGAMPGVALPAKPRLGLSYREEYSKGVAEDQSRVLSLNQQAQVPAGHYKHVLMTEDFSPIEPNVSELKFYARGSGQAVLAVDVSGGSEREELIKYTLERPAKAARAAATPRRPSNPWRQSRATSAPPSSWPAAGRSPRRRSARSRCAVEEAGSQRKAAVPLPPNPWAWGSTQLCRRELLVPPARPTRPPTSRSAENRAARIARPATAPAGVIATRTPSPSNGGPPAPDHHHERVSSGLAFVLLAAGLSPFAFTVVLSGFELENLTAGIGRTPDLPRTACSRRPLGSV